MSNKNKCKRSEHLLLKATPTRDQQNCVSNFVTKISQFKLVKIIKF